MDEALLAEQVEAVHAVGRDAFVAERTTRVRHLRQEGHRDEAAALGRLRKPTIAAWAVNRVARTHADLVAELLDAGADLRSAQVRASSGRGAEGLRPAAARVRELAGRLADEADAVLAAAGASGANRTEAEQTLFAAAVDDTLADTLRRGVFERCVEAAGFGVLAPLSIVPDVPEDGPEPSPAEPDGPTAEEQAEAARRAAAETRRHELGRERESLARDVTRRERRADRLATRAGELRARADEAVAKAEAAETEAAGAAHDLATGRARLAEVDDELAALDGDA